MLVWPEVRSTCAKKLTLVLDFLCFVSEWHLKDLKGVVILSTQGIRRLRRLGPVLALTQASLVCTMKPTLAHSLSVIVVPHVGFTCAMKLTLVLDLCRFVFGWQLKDATIFSIQGIQML